MPNYVKLKLQMRLKPALVLSFYIPVTPLKDGPKDLKRQESKKLLDLKITAPTFAAK